MSKFNSNKPKGKAKLVSNRNGGKGFCKGAESEFINYIFMGLGSTYMSETEKTDRLKFLIDKIADSKNGIEFLVKALVYARTVVGQRSITHFCAAYLVKHLSGTHYGKLLFSKYNRKSSIGGLIYRIDDMGEILAVYKALNGNNAPIPNSIKKGFRSVIENSDKMELAKYKMLNKQTSLIDIVNLTHPRQTEVNGVVSVPVTKLITSKILSQLYKNQLDISTTEIEIHAIEALMCGLLKQENTVEDKNVASGQKVAEMVASNEIGKDEAEEILRQEKSMNFSELISTQKIGYLALLRNLKNIISSGVSVDIIKTACGFLTNPTAITRSLVLPHQIDIAYSEVSSLDDLSILKTKSMVLDALMQAYDASIPNLIDSINMDINTVVVLDNSGSMGCEINKKSKYNYCYDLASLIAATFYKLFKGTAPLCVFSTYAKIMQPSLLNHNDSVFTIKECIQSHYPIQGCTNLNNVFTLFADEKIDFERIIIISDNEVSNDIASIVLSNYKKNFKIDPYVYCINLRNSETSALKTSGRVIQVDGYHSGIYEAPKKTEVDTKKVYDEIMDIKLS